MICNVRTWSFVCVRTHTGIARHTDSEPAHFWLGKNQRFFLCSWRDSNPGHLYLQSNALTTELIRHPSSWTEQNFTGLLLGHYYCSEKHTSHSLSVTHTVSKAQRHISRLAYFISVRHFLQTILIFALINVCMYINRSRTRNTDDKVRVWNKSREIKKTKQNKTHACNVANELMWKRTEQNLEDTWMILQWTRVGYNIPGGLPGTLACLLASVTEQ